MRLRDKTAVVTGGASGIGAATARLFAEEGARVFVIDVKPFQGPGVTCDVSDDEAMQGAFSRISSDLGAIDVLFNCAGIAVRHPVWSADLDEWERCFAVNTRGVFLASKYSIPLMPAGGSIVNVASVVGMTGVRDRAPYSASKGAVIALTRNMAMDLAERGIRVNCLCPGFVETDFISGILQDAGRAARLRGLHPLGRLGQPEDIARAALFFASAESDWITGQILAVDGGFTAGEPSRI